MSLEPLRDLLRSGEAERLHVRYRVEETLNHPRLPPAIIGTGVGSAALAEACVAHAAASSPMRASIEASPCVRFDDRCRASPSRSSRILTPAMSIAAGARS
jgi:hypothetical protein